MVAGPSMSVLLGGVALSDAKTAQLLSRIQTAAPGLTGIASQQVFLLLQAQPGALDAESVSRLEAILSAKLMAEGASEKPAGKNEARLVVLPRPGTISPWSSKATDILKMCGLSGAVQRVEHGVRFTLTGTVSSTELGAVAALLHDRMTQSVSTSFPPTAASVFGVSPRGSVRTVPVIAGGRDALVKANSEWGLALANDEIDYLLEAYRDTLKRDPTDVELMMFAQVRTCYYLFLFADELSGQL